MGRHITRSPKGLAGGLGWFSIGLGLAELLGAGHLLGMIGGRRRGVTRLYGLREIGAGVGLLRARDPGPWLWSRVGGDVLDLLSLVRGFGSARGARSGRLLALASVVGVTALDVAAARRSRR